MKNVKLAFFNFFGFISIGCIASQLIPLMNKDYSSFQKSMILGIGAMLSFFLSLWLGKISDEKKKIKPSFYFSMISYLCFICCIFLFHEKVLKGIGFILMIATSRTLMSSSETFVFYEKQKNFGKYHCMGALGLVCGSLLSSYIHDEYKVLLCLGSGIISMLLIAKVEEKPKEGKKIEIKDILTLLKNKQYILTVFIFFFLMLMGFADQYVVVDKMVSLKASKIMISMKYALQASMEIPIYLCMNKIFSKIKMINLLLFCIGMSAIKFALYGLANTPLLILFVSLLQVFTHPLIVVLSKKMIQLCTPPELMASSQIIGFAVYFGISGFITSLLGQWLSQKYSYDFAIYMFSLFSVFPFILWYFIRKYDKVDKKVIE